MHSAEKTKLKGGLCPKTRTAAARDPAISNASAQDGCRQRNDWPRAMANHDPGKVVGARPRLHSATLQKAHRPGWLAQANRRARPRRRRRQPAAPAQGPAPDANRRPINKFMHKAYQNKASTNRNQTAQKIKPRPEPNSRARVTKLRVRWPTASLKYKKRRPLPTASMTRAPPAAPPSPAPAWA